MLKIRKAFLFFPVYFQNQSDLSPYLLWSLCSSSSKHKHVLKKAFLHFSLSLYIIAYCLIMCKVLRTQ